MIERLKAHVDMGDDTDKDTQEAVAWLEWAHDFLSNRALYHKKQHLKKAMMIKMAKTLLAPDEIERIEAESEEQAAAELDKEIES